MNNPAASCEVSNTNTIIQNTKCNTNTHTSTRSKLRGILSIKLPCSGSPVYFGEKKIGKILSINTNDINGVTCGIMRINLSFPLYNNMSFYLEKDETGNSRYEIRINPTIEKNN